MLYTFVHLARAGLIIAPVVVAAVAIARLTIARRDPVLRATTGLLGAFVFVALIVGALGLAGWMNFAALTVALWIAASALVAVVKIFAPATQDGEPWPAAPRGLLAFTLFATTIAVGMFAARAAYPALDYDALTYHLHFPAQWLRAGRIFLMDTPFGDAAPAYAPAHGEMWYAWLMAPFVGATPGEFAFKLAGLDALAKIGQFPFLVLAALSLLLLSRRLGRGEWTTYLPALTFALVPWAFVQAAGANVDLMLAACLLAALALAIEYAHEPRFSYAALAGAALGMAAGVKFLALAYALLIALPSLALLWKHGRARAVLAWALPLLACGAPWYLRNWIVAGNPLFPAEFLWFAGAYGRAAMLASPFHAPNLPAALAVTMQAYGVWFVPLGVGGMIVGLSFLRRRGAWRAVGWIAPAALLWHFLFVPYSSQDRFLLWVVGLSLLPLARWPIGRRNAGLLVALLTPVIGLMLVGPGRAFHIGLLPVAASGWLQPAGWMALLVVLLGMGVPAFLLRRYSARGWYWAALLLLGATIALWPAQIDRGAYMRAGGGVLREMPLTGYAHLWRLRPKAVAYAGRNRPYYLAGRGGVTRVTYVNVDGRRAARLHDYVREAAARSELDPMREKDNWRRRAPDYAAWRNALLAEKIEYLVVERLAREERDYLRHDEGGFPLERIWARAHPEDFQLIELDPQGLELYLVIAVKP